MRREKGLTNAFTNRGWKWWALCPDVQTSYFAHQDTARDVIKAMLACVRMRRGMNTITQLPHHDNGDPWIVCPRDGIPPHIIETHELSHGIHKAEVDKFMNQNFQDLARGDDNAGVVDLTSWHGSPSSGPH